MSDVSRETLVSRFFPDREAEILRYAEILATWGIERGLIGPREGDRIWDRHIANCIPVASLAPLHATVIDIGSGAGLPGIVIALTRPDLAVTLLEPLQRRMDFLEEVVKELALPISLLRGRAEGIKGSYDIVTARAVAPLPKLLPMVWHLLAPNGTVLAMKGESAESELAITKVKKSGKAEIITLAIEGLPTARVIQVRKTG
ncbi:MAG: 16S rRNA (guanine(527)-N(7))-methyltransferase RsmG [Actinomycetes bacterium]